MRKALYCLLAFVVSVAASHAQPVQGNWVVGDSFTAHGGILYIDPSQTPPASLSTLIFAGSQGRVNSISMFPNNRDFLVGFSTLPNLALVDVAGTIVSLEKGPSSAKRSSGGASATARAASGATPIRTRGRMESRDRRRRREAPVPEGVLAWPRGSG